MRSRLGSTPMRIATTLRFKKQLFLIGFALNTSMDCRSNEGKPLPSALSKALLSDASMELALCTTRSDIRMPLLA